MDYEAAAQEVDEAQRRAEKRVPELDLIAHRSALEMSPLSFDSV
jgi:hypothetical protein